jgi:hypothetical protein
METMDHISNRSFTARLALLTTGLLLALSAPATAKDDPDGMVSEIRDDRIKESSGLALSMKHDDLVYTMNDEGGAKAKVYAVKVSTGEVVGAADIGGLPIEDPESIAVDSDGTLWLGDLGDNDHQRDDIAIYAFPEPGPGERTVSGADRYRVTLPGGPQDVEGLLVHPQTDRVYLVSKNEDGNGRIFELSDLQPGDTAQAKDIGEAPEGVTDATFTHSGQWAVLRTEDDLWLYDPRTWEAVGQAETPKLDQGESVTVERGDQTVLLGSEGKNSPIVRAPLPNASGSVSISDNSDGDGDGDDDDGGSTVRNSLELAIPLGLVAAAMLVGGILLQRRLKV